MVRAGQRSTTALHHFLGPVTMSRAIGVASLVLLTCLGVTYGGAQERPFHFPVPSLDAVHLTKAVAYTRVDTSTLAMDIYRPKNAPSAAPALVFYGLYWPESNDRPPREANDQALRWARIAASRGIVAIIPDLRAEPGTGTSQRPTRAREGELERLLAHLTQHAGEYGIDRRRIALFAASGSVAAALPAITNPRRTEIGAAVLYYGGAGADVATFRPDVPILWVRAGRDSPGMNAAIDRLTSRAVAQNVPLTLINYASGHHAFEAVDDTAATRQVIEQTIEFVKGVPARE
jgi:dienelactone hydrolase